MTGWKCALHIMRKDDSSIWQGCPADCETVEAYLNYWGCDNTITAEELEGKDFVIHDGDNVKAVTAQEIVNDFVPLQDQWYNTPNPFVSGGEYKAYFDIDSVCDADYLTETITDDNGNEEDFLCL